MIISKSTPCQKIVLWTPRWRDRTAMIAQYKVGQHNEVTFSKAKSMPDAYYITGEEVRKHPLQPNGKLMCYCVPLDKLELLERS